MPIKFLTPEKITSQSKRFGIRLRLEGPLEKLEWTPDGGDAIPYYRGAGIGCDGNRQAIALFGEAAQNLPELNDQETYELHGGLPKIRHSTSVSMGKFDLSFDKYFKVDVSDTKVTTPVRSRDLLELKNHNFGNGGCGDVHVVVSEVIGMKLSGDEKVFMLKITDDKLQKSITLSLWGSNAELAERFDLEEGSVLFLTRLTVNAGGPRGCFAKLGRGALVSLVTHQVLSEWWNAVSKPLECLTVNDYEEKDAARLAATTVKCSELAEICSKLPAGGWCYHKIQVQLLEIKGALYYNACAELNGNRSCGREVDEMGECPKCEKAVRVEPRLKIHRGKFGDETDHVRVTVFGEQASRILGIDAVTAERLEQECIQMSDESRTRQRNAVRGAFDKFWLLGLELKEIGSGGNITVSATAYSVEEIVLPSSDAKRARLF